MQPTRSKNALTHGLYAREATLPWEDQKAFAAYCDAIRDELNPVGPLEEEVAREVAELQWRKQRIALGWLLQFYKEVPPTELIEAAKGGLETLAAYLRGLAEAEPTGPRTLWMSSMQVLDYIKKRKANHATENAADEGSPQTRPNILPSRHSTALPSVISTNVRMTRAAWNGN